MVGIGGLLCILLVIFFSEGPRVVVGLTHVDVPFGWTGTSNVYHKDRPILMFIHLSSRSVDPLDILSIRMIGVQSLDSIPEQ